MNDNDKKWLDLNEKLRAVIEESELSQKDTASCVSQLLTDICGDNKTLHEVCATAHIVHGIVHFKLPPEVGMKFHEMWDVQ